MSVVRWIFIDGATTWTVPLNPNQMSTPYPTKQRQTQPGRWGDTTGLSILTLQTPVTPFEWTFGGVIRTEDHYDQLLAWSKKDRVIQITDHYGRTWSVLLVEFAPEDRKPTPLVIWRLKYTMRALMLGRIS